MRKLPAILIALTVWAQAASSATYAFDILGRDGRGDPIHASMSYSTPPARRVGNDHFYHPGQETLRVWNDKGFDLTLSNLVTGFGSFVGSGGFPGFDFFYAQSFLSEGPNEWHILIDIRTAPGWLDGRGDLPEAFPRTFTSAYFEAFKTDEYERIESHDAIIVSVSPATAAVPLPPSALLTCSVLLAMGLYRRAGRRQRRPT
jgi:hypothetical protein